MNRSFAAPVAALLVAAGLAAPAAMAAPEPPQRVEQLMSQHVPGEVVVRYSARTDAAERAEVRGEHDLDRVESLGLPNTEVVEVEPGTVTETVAALTDDPSVVFAEPNYVYRAFGTPDDPQFQDLWALHQASDVDVDAPQAWDLTTGSPAVTVAVVDTGVAVDHPELAPNVWQNPGESGGGKESNHVDDDDNGYVDDYRGWDWVGDDRHPRDLHGHGTHVAGTIGARGNDGAGIAGVSWGSKIMALRALNSGGEGNTGDLASAFTYAARNGAKVVNVSLGGANYSLAVLNAITAAPDTLFVVAAGNAGANNDLGSSYPCNYPLPNIVCVAATDSSDQLASYSNYGATSVDLAAPGSGILSLQPAIVTRFWEDFGTDPAGRWAPGGATGTWARDPGGFVSDSPGGNYSDNADHSLALSSPVDLTGMNDCLVRYALKLDVEEGHDELVVEASTNGTDWTRAGAWTGSSGGEWTGVTDSLFAYDGRPSVYLRFRLLSNGSVTADGASIDNVGVRCYSTSFTGSELMWASGTSMAAPHVAGVAALAWSAAPDAPVAAVARALIDGADDTAAMAGKSVAGGRLNACATVALVAGASPAACTDATSAATASPKPATAPTHTPTPAPSPEPSASPTPTPSPTPSATPAPTPGPTPTSSPAPTPETTPSPEPAPDPGPQRPDPVVHDRIVKLRMEPGLVARGRVRAPDGYDACKAEVLVKIVRNGRVVARLTTRPNGRFRVELQDRPGRYAARAPETSPDPTAVCSSAASKTRRV